MFARPSGAATLADDFANATPLVGFTNASGSNVGATAEPFEPAHAGEPAAHSVWARWTATTAGTYSISTSNSLTPSRLWMDTVLAVYTGSALTNLTPVISNDDLEPFNTWSRVVFRAYAGETFRIAVDGLGASGTGTINLQIGPGGPFMAAWMATDLKGVTVSSLDYGNQILLVDFWETTCSTCVEELPELIRLYQTLHPRGFSIIGLSSDPNPSYVQQYFSTNPAPPYLVGMSSLSASNSLGGPAGFPTKYLVDQERRIVGRYLGAAPNNPPSSSPDPYAFYDRLIEPLLRSPPRVSLQVGRDGGNLKISWPATELGYRVQASVNPISATWVDVQVMAETINGRFVVTLPASEEAQFFRVEKE